VPVKVLMIMSRERLMKVTALYHGTLSDLDVSGAPIGYVYDTIVLYGVGLFNLAEKRQ